MVKHYKIRNLDNGGFYISPRITFSGLHELVRHYTSESARPDPLRCVPCLLHPSWGTLHFLVESFMPSLPAGGEFPGDSPILPLPVPVLETGACQVEASKFPHIHSPLSPFLFS